MVPSGNVAWLGTPSGSELALAGMLKAAQCSTSLVLCANAVSGSSTTTAKLWVPGGALVQESCGDTGAELTWLYLSGMTPPSVKDVLVRPIGGGGVVGAFCASAGTAASKLAPRSKERKESMRVLLGFCGRKQTAFSATRPETETRIFCRREWPINSGMGVESRQSQRSVERYLSPLSQMITATVRPRISPSKSLM